MLTARRDGLEDDLAETALAAERAHDGQTRLSR
jgi:hypothetical protein